MIYRHNDYSLLKHNTFGMDVKARCFIEYTTVDDLRKLLVEMARTGENKSMLSIGGGSNLLFAGDFKGTVLHSLIKGVEICREDDNAVWLRVGAGENWDDFVAYCVAHQWYGAENLSAIPGEVGASAIQNIGAYGAEVKDIIAQVEVVEVDNAEKHVFEVQECKYSYRQSIFKNEWKGKFIVTYVMYKLSKIPVFHIDYGNLKAILEGKSLTLENVRNAVCEVRHSKLPDPSVLGNAGSFFMNPIVPREQFDKLRVEYPSIPYYEVDECSVKIPAGWMIDQCGWKGRSLGNAGVHDKQALVLVNLGSATGKDIMQLAHKVQEDVKRKFGIDIHPEVNYIG